MYFVPKQMGVRLTLVEKFEGIKIGVRNNPEQKLLDMGDIAWDVSSYEDHQPMSETHVLLKFLDALPHEYDTQREKQEDHVGPL